jgi:hypothetical protein
MKMRERIDHTLTLLNGMIIGAMIMYVFDERQGGEPTPVTNLSVPAIFLAA